MLLKTKCDHLHHVCADGLAPWWWKWSRRGFSLFTAYQILSAVFYFQGVLHTAITDAVYCVKLVVSDRRVANKLRKGLDKVNLKSYNTTPAKEEMECCSLLRPHSLTMWFDLFLTTYFRCFLSGRPHAAVGVFLSCFLCSSSLPAELFWEALLHLKMMTTYHFLGHGFDHILDHSHIRSTRR